MNQIAATDPAKSPDSRPFSVVAQNDRGQWVARERRGLIEGAFLTQRDAIRFALFETGSRAAAVVVDDAGSTKRH